MHGSGNASVTCLSNESYCNGVQILLQEYHTLVVRHTTAVIWFLLSTEKRTLLAWKWARQSSFYLLQKVARMMVIESRHARHATVSRHPTFLIVIRRNAMPVLSCVIGPSRRLILSPNNLLGLKAFVARPVTVSKASIRWITRLPSASSRDERGPRASNFPWPKDKPKTVARVDGNTS